MLSSTVFMPWRLALVSSVVLFAEGTHLRSAGLPGGEAIELVRQEQRLHRSTICADEQAMVEAAHPPHHPSRLGFIVHRKTGFVMSFHVSMCFDTDGSVVQRLMDPQIDSPHFVPGSKEAVYAHLARDPVDLAVSNFLYNKFTSHEPHTVQKGTATQHLRLCQNQHPKVFRELPVESGDESMREYLQRVSNHSGLLATLCESTPMIGSMLRISNWCKDHSEKCTQVFLNDLMGSSETFMSSFKRIAKLAGYKWTPELQHCLSYQDVNSPNFGSTGGSHNEHCSTFSVTHEKREQIKMKAAQLDRRFMDGYYAEASHTLQHA